MALSAEQLDVLVEAPAAITAEQAATFNAIAIPETDADSVAAIAPWLASVGIAGPPPRVGQLARRLVAAAERIAARG